MKLRPGLLAERSLGAFLPGSSFSPLQLPNLELFVSRGKSSFFQISDGTTAAGNGDPVGYAEDVSPSGLNLLQATSGNRPELAADAIGFDGVDAKLDVPVGALGASAMTICLLAKIPSFSLSNGDRLLASIDPGASINNQFQLYIDGVGDTLTWFVPHGSGRISGAISVVSDYDDEWVLLFCDHNVSGGSMEAGVEAIGISSATVKAKQSNSTSGGNPPAQDSFTLGARYSTYAELDLNAMVITHDVMTDANRAKLAKWAKSQVS